VSPRPPYWNRPEDLLAWLAQLRDLAHDLGEAGIDLTRPELERELGAVLAREAITSARTQLYSMLDLAIESLGEGSAGRGGLN
jgi:hypothetical protein